MKILAISNQKGGVGKSTLACNCVYSAREAGKRVLLVDLDSLGNFSGTFLPTGAHEGEVSTAAELFAEGSTIVPEVLEDGLAVIRADKMLAELTSSEEIIRRPARYLRALAADYDVCIIDTPGILAKNPPTTIAGLIAAAAVVCPFSIGRFEAEALSDLWGYLRGIKSQGYNPSLRLMGLLPSRIETRSKREMDTLAELREQFGTIILPLMLVSRVSVRDSTADRKPVWRNTKGAGHLAAAKEWRAATTYILKDLGAI